MSTVGQQTPADIVNAYAGLAFIIQQWIGRVATVSIAKITAVNASATPPNVSLQILVNMIDAQGVPTPHGVITGCPYFRYQGGSSAVILDPVVGDIGIVLFAMRDISNVVATQAQANPGSKRKYNYTDAIYVGGLLNGTPTQYVEFTPSGITILSPQKITLQAPNIDIEGASAITINSPAVTIEGGGTKVDGKVFLTHEHSGVQAGGSNTGPVV